MLGLQFKVCQDYDKVIHCVRDYSSMLLILDTRSQHYHRLSAGFK